MMQSAGMERGEGVEWNLDGLRREIMGTMGGGEISKA